MPHPGQHRRRSRKLHHHRGRYPSCLVLGAERGARIPCGRAQGDVGDGRAPPWPAWDDAGRGDGGQRIWPGPVPGLSTRAMRARARPGDRASRAGAGGRAAATRLRPRQGQRRAHRPAGRDPARGARAEGTCSASPAGPTAAGCPIEATRSARPLPADRGGFLDSLGCLTDRERSGNGSGAARHGWRRTEGGGLDASCPDLGPIVASVFEAWRPADRPIARHDCARRARVARRPTRVRRPSPTRLHPDIGSRPDGTRPPGRDRGRPRRGAREPRLTRPRPMRGGARLRAGWGARSRRPRPRAPAGAARWSGR